MVLVLGARCGVECRAGFEVALAALERNPQRSERLLDLVRLAVPCLETLALARGQLQLRDALPRTHLDLCLAVGEPGGLRGERGGASLSVALARVECLRPLEYR